MNPNLTDEQILDLQIKAVDIRMSIIESLAATKTDKYGASGHTAGPLGMADIFTLLYFHSMKHDPHNPSWPDRDRLILSNGHICPVLYATMAHAGYFPTEELKTLRHFGSRLQGHPHREFLPMVETSSGPLGSGLSQAVGMAIADRINGGDKKFYVLMGDGEQNEGNVWEAALLAGKEKLRNIVAIVDRNFIQIDGDTEKVLPLGDLVRKYEEFGWHAQEVDGHNFREVNDAINRAHAVANKPSITIAITVPSKGVKSFEGDYRWHGNPPGGGPEDKVPKAMQKEVALAELQAIKDELLKSKN